MGADTHVAMRGDNASTLPEWDLTDLYPAMDSAELHADLAASLTQAQDFSERYAKIETLSSEDLAKAIKAYEALSETMGRIGSYAQLCYALQTNTPAVAQFYQNVQEKLTTASSLTLFFTLALNRLSDAAMETHLNHDGVAHYAAWLRDVRSLRPYQLADDMEKLLHEKYVSGAAAWNRLFDETLTSLRFPYEGKKLTEAEAFNKLSDSDGAVRKKAAASIGRTLKSSAPVFTLITNTLAKDKETEDRWRGFKQPISSRNVANYIEDEVVDALLKSVRAAYPSLSHRYYRLKAKWMGVSKLDYWDRNAPLPFDNNRNFSWGEAESLVLDAYRKFSPELADVGQRFFGNGWIDAPVKAGKSPGAFAHPTVPSAHPYLLLNFQGKARDVMTLAHELGHGVHQVLSAKQGALMADTPLTLAETASVFGEQLTFQEMVRREPDATRRKALIASKVEDMLNTVVRQIAFCTFEERVHAARREGELTTEQINAIWLKVQKESLGSAVKLGGNYGYYWSYIPHFVHTPFYVYAYAFGDCLVNSLYAAYEKEKAAGNAKVFEQKYLTMLQAGGTLRHKELLAPFGLDASKPDFWQQGLDVIARYIDELEAA